MMSTRRAFLSAGGASAIALSLAACSRSQTKTAETLASGTPIAEPVLNDKQLAEILQRVQTGLAAADKEKSEAKVKEVMSGLRRDPRRRVPHRLRQWERLVHPRHDHEDPGRGRGADRRFPP